MIRYVLFVCAGAAVSVLLTTLLHLTADIAFFVGLILGCGAGMIALATDR